MKEMKLDNEVLQSKLLPPFSVTIKDSHVTAIYSDTEIQIELVNAIRHHGDFQMYNQQDGLYERLSVQDNITFFHKWFGCRTPLPEILVMFGLQNCAKTTLKKCTAPEIRRVYFAKYFMAGAAPSTII